MSDTDQTSQATGEPSPGPDLPPDAGWMSGHQVLAAEMVVRYRRMVPLCKVVEARAQLIGAEGRKVRVEGRILGPDGRVSCEGQGLYIEPSREKLDNLALDMPNAMEGL